MFMKIKTMHVILILSIGCISGCANFGTYIKDRANDFADCFKLGVGLPAGLEMHCRITDAFAVGIGYGASVQTGFRKRRFGFWESVHSGSLFFSHIPGKGFAHFPITYYGMVGAIKPRYIYGFLPMPGSYEVKSILFWPVSMEKEPKYTDDEYEKFDPNTIRGKPFEDDLLNAFDIEVGASAGVLLGLSFSAGFSFGEFADFLLGWFGYDIACDDTYWQEFNLSGSQKEDLKKILKDFGNRRRVFYDKIAETVKRTSAAVHHKELVEPMKQLGEKEDEEISRVLSDEQFEKYNVIKSRKSRFANAVDVLGEAVYENDDGDASNSNE